MSNNTAFEVKVWGCRGSMPISGPESIKYGGNTTCFEIKSGCLPPNLKLFVDAGSGFFRAGNHYVSEMGNGINFMVLFTHYHMDHTTGLTMSPLTFFQNVPMALWGPRDERSGPKDEVMNIFCRPRFPVDAKSVMGKMTFRTIEGYDVTVIVIHPEGGTQTIPLDKFQQIERDRRQITINKNRYKLEDCLVIKMQKANHGNSNCITYRFEERPTGKVCVICTDHEDPNGISMALRNHMRGADVLIIDAQYDNSRYEVQTAGFGHGTPWGIMRQAIMTGVKRVAITHHDPAFGTDDYLENTILADTLAAFQKLRDDGEFLTKHRIQEIPLRPEEIFLCQDYMTITV